MGGGEGEVCRWRQRTRMAQQPLRWRGGWADSSTTYVCSRKEQAAEEHLEQDHQRHMVQPACKGVGIYHLQNVGVGI